MRIAVISDLHGNMRALDAVLDDIERERADQVFCAGDMVNPFLRSLDLWQKLKTLGIPCVRGNHEDYLIAYHRPELRPGIRESFQFRPVQLVARHFGEQGVAELARLPLSLTIPGPKGDDVFVCHASPKLNNRSFLFGVNDEMAAALSEIPARVVVAGHIHLQWQGQWSDKTLIVAGSVGLPLSGKPRPEYVILEHYGGRWHNRHKTVAYDQQGALQEYVESGCAAGGGPIGWMLYDELSCADPRLAGFLPWIQRRPGGIPSLEEEWNAAGREFLEGIGRWEALRPIASG